MCFSLDRDASSESKEREPCRGKIALSGILWRVTVGPWICLWTDYYCWPCTFCISSIPLFILFDHYVLQLRGTSWVGENCVICYTHCAGLSSVQALGCVGGMFKSPACCSVTELGCKPASVSLPAVSVCEDCPSCTFREGLARVCSVYHIIPKPPSLGLALGGCSVNSG